LKSAYSNIQLSDRELTRIRETDNMIPHDVSSLLEVGCGDGRVSRRVREKVSVTGIDINPHRIDGYPGDKVVGDIAHLPMKSNQFDMVLSCEVLEHLTDKTLHAALSEIERITNKYILITVPFKETLPAQWRKCSKCSHIYHAWGHLRAFDVKTLRVLFTRFRLAETKFLGPKEPRIPSLLYIIARKLGNVWDSDSRNPSPCPKCGSLPISNPGNIFGKLFIRFLWRLERTWLLKKAVWIGCLYLYSAEDGLFRRHPNSYNTLADNKTKVIRMNHKIPAKKAFSSQFPLKKFGST
jgi:SAM-dependent methyltransferase